MASKRKRRSVIELARMLEQVDSEPRVREQPWRPYRRSKRTGL